MIKTLNAEEKAIISIVRLNKATERIEITRTFHIGCLKQGVKH